MPDSTNPPEEATQPVVKRQAVYATGPRFFTDGEEIKYEFVIDGGNKIGPTKATDEHIAEHPAAWEAFNNPHQEGDDAAPAKRKKA